MKNKQPPKKIKFPNAKKKNKSVSEKKTKSWGKKDQNPKVERTKNLGGKNKKLWWKEQKT